MHTASKWPFHLVSGFIPSSVHFSFSCSVVYLTSLPPHAGASGHTVSLLAVTVVLVLQISTGGEGNYSLLMVFGTVASYYLKDTEKLTCTLAHNVIMYKVNCIHLLVCSFILITFL